eukprot:scaffold5264_cov125-Skeletonema_dohrnii-CCMP3373.AAC.7
MDHHTDPAFFTDEEIANFAEHIAEQGLRIYLSSSSISSVHAGLKDVVSDELDLKDATSASIVPMASHLAAVREEDTIREPESCRISLPYVHDENRYHQMMMNCAHDDDREKVVEATKETPEFQESSNCSELNESDGMCASVRSQGTEQEVDSITNEHHVDDSSEVSYEEVHKTSLDYSSEDDYTDNNEVEETELQPDAQQQTSKAPRKRSSYSDINAGIVAQREKIRDICNNRQKSSKKKKQVRRGNYFKEVRQRCGDESSEEEEEQSYEKQAEHPKQQKEVDDANESGDSASEGFLDTEDEQSDDLIEFETQTVLPIARKRMNNSLLATSEAIGSSIAKAAIDGGGDSEWIGRATKRRSKLKKSTKRVSLDTSSSKKPSANKQNSTATQQRNRGGRRSVGFGAAPKAVNKRKTQLSLLQMLKK